MYEQAITFDELYKAGLKCFRNVRWKDSIVGYEYNLIRNTVILQNDVKDGKYKISPYQQFTIYEPKERRIVATRVRDRQLQRSICDNGFYDMITRHFITDNCACLKNRGIDYALNRMTKHLREHNRQYGNEGYVLNIDIRHYFASIDHELAKEVINKKVEDKQIAQKVNQVIDSFEEGLGLGSQISQLVALAFLDDLDHFIKERLHIKHYIRYMDDLVIIHNDKKYLEYCLKVITEKIKELKLEVNKKTKIYPIKTGVKFLQWNFKIMPSGKILRKMNKRKTGKERQKLKRIYAKECKGEYKKGSTELALQGWLANAKRGNTFYQRDRMIKYKNNLFKGEKNNEYRTEN